jgi:hypothetical protein
MTAPQRIYVVRNSACSSDNKSKARLVRAPNAAQALRHVASDTLDVEVASQDALIDLVSSGVSVENSGRGNE